MGTSLAPAADGYGGCAFFEKENPRGTDQRFLGAEEDLGDLALGEGSRERLVAFSTKRFIDALAFIALLYPGAQPRPLLDV